MRIRGILDIKKGAPPHYYFNAHIAPFGAIVVRFLSKYKLDFQEEYNSSIQSCIIYRKKLCMSIIYTAGDSMKNGKDNRKNKTTFINKGIIKITLIIIFFIFLSLLLYFITFSKRSFKGASRPGHSLDHF